MPHNISYSLFPKDVEHDMPDLAKLQRPGSSRSIDQNCANTQPASYATVAPLKWTKAQPSSSANGASFPSLPEPFPMKMTSSEHKRAHSDPAGPPHPSRHFTLSRLRRTISAPINEKPRIVHVKRCGAKEKERKNTTHEPSRPLNPVNKAEGHIKAINNLQAPPPARSHSTDIKTSSRNFIRASPSIASQDSLNAPLPPLPPPPSPPFVPRPLSTLEEEAPEPVELPATPVLPVIQLNDCKPWIPAAIESPTRAHAAAPPPLKLRPPIKEGAAAPPPALTLSIPPKEQRPVTAPEPAPTPVSPPTSRPPPRPRNKKHVRFVPTSPEIITDATIQAARRDRVQPTRKSSMQKNRNSWSTVFLLSAPSTATDTNSRPSTSPGLKSAQPTGQKSILRRSNSFQNIRPDDAANDADADDDDIEIKPLESHVHLVINAAMEKNLKRLPRSKTSAHLRKNNPLPALPALAETPPTPTHAPNTTSNSNPNSTYHDDRASRASRHATTTTHSSHRPASPASPPLPLFARKFQKPVVINHPPSPPSSSSSRDGSPASSRSSSIERDESAFRAFAMGDPLRFSMSMSKKAGLKEERVGRAEVRVVPERVVWRAVA